MEFEKLSQILPIEMGNATVAAWDCAAKLLPEFENYQHIASGLLAISIPMGENNFALLFRPEQVRTIAWGGNPSKLIDPADNRIRPRKSFAAWYETVKGHSLPWTQFDLDAAEEIRAAFISENLDKEFKKEQALRLKLERVSKERHDLIAMVSHDVRTPLQSIGLTLHVLSKVQQGDTVERVRGQISLGRRNLDTVMQLVEQLLQYLRTEEGKLSLDKQIWEAGSLLQDAFELLQPVATEKQLDLQYFPPPRLNVRCDRSKTMQVLSNLVGNAVKFTAKGKVVMSAAAMGENVEFKVEDTGPGIPPHMVPRVFDQFWQATNTDKRGSGLGLAISKSIIEAHGGNIWVESAEGRGSAFHFTLPKA